MQAILPTSVPLMESTPTPLATATPVPQPSPTPPPVTTETVLVKHIVEGGETLLSIALQYNVTVEAIQQANGLTNELIRIGDELTIPRSCARVLAPRDRTGGQFYLHGRRRR